MFSLPRLTISAKLILIFITTLILALGSTSFLWVRTVRSILQKEVTIKQNQLGTRASEKVEEFLDAKVRALIIHSQSAAFLSQDAASQNLDLAIFLTQDQDIKKLVTINPQGMETLKLTRDALSSDPPPLENRSSSPSFLTNTFRYTKEYISEVQFSDTGEPFLVVSIPIKTPVSVQRLTELSTQALSPIAGSNELVLGVLEATISLNGLFNEITDLGLDHNTSVFIVDKQGRIIAHKDSRLVSPVNVEDTYPPVHEHLVTDSFDPINHNEIAKIFEYPDENNLLVLGSHSHVKETGWAIIAQQSAAKAYADVNRVLRFALFLLLAGALASIPIAYFLSQRITRPILALTAGADKISAGDLDYRIQVTTKDELEQMALAFNNMTQKLKGSIVELKKDKDIIASEKNKLELVIYGIEDSIIAVDHSKAVVLTNPAAQKLLGVNTKDIVGHTLTDIFTLSDKNGPIPPSIYCPDSSDLSEGLVYENKDIKLTPPVGTEKYVNIITGKISQGLHSDLDYILTLHDVTQERQLEDMKLDFVSLAAHELRTPLTSIIGYTKILLDEAAKSLSENYIRMIGRIYFNSKRLGNLVDNLLAVSRIERGEFRVSFAPFDLLKTATSSIEELQPLTLPKKQSLEFATPLATAMVFGDEFKMAEVFSNLIANAVNYTPDQGRITVTITKINTGYQVIVKDTGIGIPPEAIPNLFTKFFRVPKGLDQNTKGTGLGLYITKSIIDLHGGKIWLESQVGIGTTVFFELPEMSPQNLASLSPDPNQTPSKGIVRNPKSL